MQIKNSKKNIIFLILIFTSLDSITEVNSSKIQYNFNNHGVVGLINTPTARFLDEEDYGVTLYAGDPDQKITLSSNPYHWLEASFFYTNIQNKKYCGLESDPICDQDYRDKGFNLKIKILDENKFPAVAIGINDIAGTGLYGSEYIVANKKIKKFDFHVGMGWGALNGHDDFKNPFIALDNRFSDRPSSYSGNGGEIEFSRYFSDEKSSLFYGFSYDLSPEIQFKLEKDSTLTPGKIGYSKSENKLSYAIDFLVNKNISIGLSRERNNYTGIKITYKNSKSLEKKKYKYQKGKFKEGDSKYYKLIKNIENNGIGVNKIIENENSVGIELTQFTHGDIETIEEIILYSSLDAEITKEIKVDYRIANLKATSNLENQLSSNLIYEKTPKIKRKLNSSNNISFRPFLASRESFLKGALILQNDSQYIINDGFFFSSNLKFSIWDNFDDLILPPKDTYPEQVRSDIKDYLRNFDNGIIIGRAQFDYHFTPFKDHHFMFTAGILEEMFSGAGVEYLYSKNSSNYAVGFEIFNVSKRDYKMRLKNRTYSNISGFLNFYYRNYNHIPFDMKLSYGEYLAGDIGSTFELSRSFKSGTKFGVFATFTDVSKEEFGEGSFDKGIFFNVPIYQNYINYTWRPLTKDPGARINRQHTLYDLLIKFKKI